MNPKFEGMFEAVSESSMCGEDLSYSPEFDRIKEARREDDATIEYGEWQSDLKQANWPLVVESCTDLLIKRSKDLRLSAWLTEGLVKTNGLAGLADGIDVAVRLIERFGGKIHPQPEAGDQEQRIGNISWLVMRMAQLVRQIPITQSKVGQFNLNDYESARLLQTQLQRNPDAVPEDKVTLDKFAVAASKTDKTRYTGWLADAAHCRSSLAELVRVADTLFGNDGPSFGPLSESLEAIEDRLQRIAKELGIISAAETTSENASEDQAENEAGNAASSIRSGPIKTRAQALDQLRQVATFFRNTEPHSPVAYLADKAAHWGDMPLHVWLRSVMKDQGGLSHIEELLGLGQHSEQE
ncbi:MAG TPA: type VI secretion system protein TssA [Burkholderiaceae bacterium]|jgi:type VI secretion system protein ImpA